MAGEAGRMRAKPRLEVVGGQPGQLAAVLAEADRALYGDGDLKASRAGFERAWRLAELAGDADAMARAALGLAGLWVSERRTVTGAVLVEARLEHALSLLDERSALALRIRARLAAEADYRSGGRSAITEVLGEARAAGDPVPLAEALSLALHCLLGPDDAALRRALAVELVKASFRTERRSDRLMGLMWQTVGAFARGDPHAARYLGELRDQLSERGHAAVGFIVSAIDVMLAIRAGALGEAESLAGICAASGAAAGDVDTEWWPGGQLVTIRWYQGRLAELLPALAERVRSPALSAVDNSPVAALAVAAALGGDDRTAASCLAVLCGGGGLAALPRSSSWLVTVNGVAEAAYLLADAPAAGQVYDVLRGHPDLPMVGGLGVTCFGSVRQALGLAALTLGRPGQAVEHLRAAVESNIALAHWPAVIAARRRLADAYRLRAEPGDAQAAGRELGTAAREAAALGLPHPGAAGTGGDARASGAGTGDQGTGTGGTSTGGTSTGGAAAGCRRAGRKWQLSLGDRSVLVPDSVGMLHLAVLIANPRQDVPAVDLVAGLAAVGGVPADGGSAQPVLDAAAIVAYRQRLAQLAGPGAAGDPGEAARLAAEREWVAGQLAAATGLGGRTRSFAGDAERARVSAGKAIRRALAGIAQADPVIGEHLRGAVRTGTRCSYWPA